MQSILLGCSLVLLFIVPSTTLPVRHTSGKDEQQKQTVLIMQGERKKDVQHINLMTSLRMGFDNQKYNLTIVTPPFKRKYVETLKENMAKLKRGDIVVWLGVNWKNSFLRIATTSHSKFLFKRDKNVFDFDSIRSRGVRLVYYQSEPTAKCEISKSDVDEMWHYSWYNLNHCKNNPTAPNLRYVPLAAIPLPFAAFGRFKDAVPLRVTTQKNNPGGLLFFGSLRTIHCWGQLQRELKHHLKVSYTAWNANEYHKALLAHNIFLSLQEHCAGGGPITFPSIKLLNAHGLIISQHIDPEDEKEYNGLIDFVAFERIPKRYQELASMNASARQQLVDQRTSLFHARFHPHHIFERAGIYNLINPP